MLPDFSNHLSPLLRLLLGMMKGSLVTVVILTSVPLRLVCPNAMGSSMRRNVSRGIILKSGKKFDVESDTTF